MLEEHHQLFVALEAHDSRAAERVARAHAIANRKRIILGTVESAKRPGD